MAGKPSPWPRLVFMAAMFLPAAAYRAYVATFFWWWFVTPTFGAEPPNLWMMSGLLASVSLVLSGYRADEPEISTPAWVGKVLGQMFVGPTVLLGMGWVYQALA